MSAYITTPPRRRHLRPAGSSCPRRARARSTRLPFCRPPHLPQPRRHRVPASNAVGLSLTADQSAVPAAIRSAPLADLPERVSSPAAVHAPSILPAPRPAAMPVPVALAVPAPVLASAHGPALAHPVRVVSADRAPALAVLRRPAKRLVRSVPTRPRAVADARNIPRRRKAR